MVYQNEQSMKERAMQEQVSTLGLNNAKGCDSANPSKAYDEPCRVGLRERVAMDLRRAERETSRAMRLSELDYLFGKYPEIARMLELMEDVRS